MNALVSYLFAESNKTTLSIDVVPAQAGTQFWSCRSREEDWAPTYACHPGPVSEYGTSSGRDPSWSTHDSPRRLGANLRLSSQRRLWGHECLPVIPAPYRSTGQAPAGIQVPRLPRREENWAPASAGATVFRGCIR